MLTVSNMAKGLKQSGIRAASVRCAQINGINLGQGICDLPMAAELKQAAAEAIAKDKNIYSACEGVKSLRVNIAKKIQNFNHVAVDPEHEIIVTHGATGGYVSAIMTLFNPGDEIILFEPFYGYHKNILELYGMRVAAVPMAFDDFSIDFDRLRQTITTNTKGIVVCTPCNPNGKVFSKSELLAIGRLAAEFNLAVITDEMYEYFIYDDLQHVSLASLENFKERTITLSGFSKTYNMTGWRLGYASGPANIIEKMALVQDLVYVCPPTPLQYAVNAAFELPESYYEDQRMAYHRKREKVMTTLRDIGFKAMTPQGAYYVMADFSELGFESDISAATMILDQAKVAVVPGSAFYSNPQAGKTQIRICYAMNEALVTQALSQMQAITNVRTGT